MDMSGSHREEAPAYFLIGMLCIEGDWRPGGDGWFPALHTNQPPSPKSKREISLQLHYHHHHCHRALCHTLSDCGPRPRLPHRLPSPPSPLLLPALEGRPPPAARLPTQLFAANATGRLGDWTASTATQSQFPARRIAISSSPIASPSLARKWTARRETATSPSSPRSPRRPSPPAIGRSFSRITTNVSLIFLSSPRGSWP
jgi:hypothetical protein